MATPLLPVLQIRLVRRVYVNREKQKGLCLIPKALGDCNTEPPYQVSDFRIFVIGDKRTMLMDSIWTVN